LKDYWNHFLLERFHYALIVDKIQVVIDHVNGFDKVVVKEKLEKLIGLIL
jgi:hypothetical protein